MRRHLVNRDGGEDLINRLAAAYVNKAKALFVIGDISGSDVISDLAIPLYETLLKQEWRKTVAKDLATACLNKALAIICIKKYQEGLDLFDRVIEIGAKLVGQEGQRSVMGQIATAQAYRATVLLNLGQIENGLRAAREAIGSLEAEIAATARVDLQETLNWLTEALDKFLGSNPQL